MLINCELNNKYVLVFIQVKFYVKVQVFKPQKSQQ